MGKHSLRSFRHHLRVFSRRWPFSSIYQAFKDASFNIQCKLIITLISCNNDAFVSCTFNTHTMINTHVSNIFIFLFQVGTLSSGLCSPVWPLGDTSIGLLLEFLTVGWRHLSPRGRYNRVGKSKESDGSRGEANEKPAAKSQALDVHVSTSARICKVQM